MAKTKISQFDATAANNTDLNSISIAEGTAPSNINNAIRELMSQLADLNLGNEVLSTLKIDNLHLDGNTIVTLDTNGDLNLTPNGTGAVTIAKVDINGGAIDGTPIGGSSASTGAFTTLSASSTANLGSSVTVSGGNIDGVIGANTPAAITGTVITANTNFAGNLTGNVTGTVDGVVGGTTPAAVTGTTITANTKFVGAIDGNVTATSGTSTFNNVTINGTLDMDSTTSQTITGLATPSGSTDAATKGYVDTEVSALVDSAPSTLNTLNELAAALGDDASFSTTVTNSIAAKLPLAGGTMTGDINLDSNSLTNLAAPSGANDAARKAYVDTADALKLNLSGGTLSGDLAMGDNKVTGLAAPTADGDAARKKYVDDILGSATSAATSASAAATSATSSATSATASASSATAAASSATSAAASLDSFTDIYLGEKSSAPTVDNDGDALVTGALYFNTSSNQLFVWSGSAWTQAAFTASGFLSASNNLSDVDSASTARTNLGLAIGSNVQAHDADLDALAGLTSAADKGIQFTGSGTAGTYDLTSAGKALLDDADAAAQRTTLGLGSAATLTAGTSANNAVQLDSNAKLPAVDGSQLTGLSDGTVNMVADGSISAGNTVALTSAGKVKATFAAGTASALQSEMTSYGDGNQYNTVMCRIADTGKIVQFYRDINDSDNNDLYYRVVTLASNGSASLGTEGKVVDTSGGGQDRLAAVYLPSIDRIFFKYNDDNDSNKQKYCIGTLSGTTISWTSPALLLDKNTFQGELFFSLEDVGAIDGTSTSDSNKGTARICYMVIGSGGGQLNNGSSYGVSSHVITVRGGTDNDVQNLPSNANSSWQSILDGGATGSEVYQAQVGIDPDNDKILFAYQDYDNSNHIKCLSLAYNHSSNSGAGSVIKSTGSSALTVKSTACNLNGEQVQVMGTRPIPYDSEDSKLFAVAYRVNSNSDFECAGVTMSNRTLSTDPSATISASVINDNSTSQTTNAIGYNATAKKFLAVYENGDISNYLYCNEISFNGNSFAKSSDIALTGASPDNDSTHVISTTTSMPSGNATPVFYNDSSNVGKLQVRQLSTDSNNLDFIGISTNAVSDGETAKVAMLGSVDDNQSSLTIGTTYYLETNNNLETSAGSSKALVGKAIAADKILVTGTGGASA